MKKLTAAWVFIFIIIVGSTGYKIDQMDRQIQQQAQIIAGYEQKTEQVFKNWDEMRSTQLVILELYEGDRL